MKKISTPPMSLRPPVKQRYSDVGNWTAKPYWLVTVAWFVAFFGGMAAVLLWLT